MFTILNENEKVELREEFWTNLQEKIDNMNDYEL